MIHGACIVNVGHLEWVKKCQVNVWYFPRHWLVHPGWTRKQLISTQGYQMFSEPREWRMYLLSYQSQESQESQEGRGGGLMDLPDNFAERFSMTKSNKSLEMSK